MTIKAHVSSLLFYRPRTLIPEKRSYFSRLIHGRRNSKSHRLLLFLRWCSSAVAQVVFVYKKAIKVHPLILQYARLKPCSFSLDVIFLLTLFFF